MFWKFKCQNAGEESNFCSSTHVSALSLSEVSGAQTFETPKLNFYSFTFCFIANLPGISTPEVEDPGRIGLAYPPSRFVSQLTPRQLADLTSFQRPTHKYLNTLMIPKSRRQKKQEACLHHRNTLQAIRKGSLNSLTDSM